MSSHGHEEIERQEQKKPQKRHGNHRFSGRGTKSKRQYQRYRIFAIMSNLHMIHLAVFFCTISWWCICCETGTASAFVPFYTSTTAIQKYRPNTIRISSRVRDNNNDHPSNRITQSPLSISISIRNIHITSTKATAREDNTDTEDQQNKKYNNNKNERTNSRSKPKPQTKNQKRQTPEIKLCRKPKQKRRKMRHPRRPSCYWSKTSNIEHELRLFWTELNVPLRPDRPPTIPSEAILNHFERHDLRYAIANMGGREVVAERLNGARLVPGKWADAVLNCREVRYLLDPKNPAGKGLSEDIPPIAPHVKKRLVAAANANPGSSIGKDGDAESRTGARKRRKGGSSNDDDDGNSRDEYEDDHMHKLRFQNGERWAHQIGRNPRGHWSEKVVVRELYEYLAIIKKERGRPSVWMPRPSELDTEGRDDLKQAIVRYGGAARICQLAQLVPFREWRYFESQLELYVELQDYLNMYHDGREEEFPKLADIKRHERLYDLIMEFGGRKLMATKLDMSFQATTKLVHFQGMNFGRFSLDFAVRLMHVIRKNMLEKNPPLENPKIQMPTKKELIGMGEDRLAGELDMYGGHESIARRLCLSFNEGEARLDALRRWADEKKRSK